MKLTCVTATYNCIKAGNRDRLIRCVESVAKLKTVHEHLIYDGASTDGTVELLHEMEATTPGLKVVSEPDKGIYNALNKGVRDAKGEWSYVLGADDYISYPDVMDRLISTVSDNIDVIITSVERNGKILRWFSADAISRTLESMPHSHQGIIMKTNVCRHLGGYDESFPICADYDMLLKAHKCGFRFRYFYEPFAEFSFGGESSKRNEETHKDFYRCRARFLRLSDAEKAFYDNYGHPPLRSLLPYFFHKDLALRCSAWSLFRMWIRHHFYPLVWLVRPMRRLKSVLGTMVTERRNIG